MTRPTLLGLAVLAVAALLAGASCGGGGSSKKQATPPFQHFRSRPDLKPPPVKVPTPAHGTSPGYIFIAPKKKVAQAGPLILDDRGQVVWFRPLLNTRGVTDFRVQRFHGQPVLTWWRGNAPKGVGSGNYTIVDSAYRLVAIVEAGNGLTGDVHEFMITPRDTALLTIYHRIDRDLSSVGGPKQGSIFEGIVQELDIASGRVLFEWHSASQVGLRESYTKAPAASKGKAAPPYDYFHVNSIDVDKDGDLLVSARNTHTVYKLSRRTGKILWRLGGKQSDFTMAKGTRFAFQHDARRQPDGTITLFDNEAEPKVGDHSRVIVLRVDEQRKRATLVRSYAHTPELLSGSQGNAQFLPDGHVVVGWGANPWVTEFDAEGQVVFDVHFLQSADSYRAYRLAWTGHPTDRPAVAAGPGEQELAASWNGATEVAGWQALAGDDPQRLEPVGAAVPKTGFETVVPVSSDARYVGARALSKTGQVLGTSWAVERSPR